MHSLPLLASTFSWTSLALGLALGVVLGGAFLLLRRRSVTLARDETAGVARAHVAAPQTAPAAAAANPQLTGETRTMSSAEAQEMLHEFFPNLEANLKPGETPTVLASEPRISTSTSTRVLTGEEAEQFLHSTGLDRTVAAALGQAAGTQPFRPASPPLPPVPLAPLKLTRRSPLWTLLWIAIGLVPLGFVAHSLFSTFAPAQMGTITSTGPALGDWTMNVDSCHTGMTRGFYGAQLYSSKDQRLGVWMVEDPLRGLVASVNSTTHGDAINLSRDNCAVLSGSATNTGTTVNNVRVLQGEYTLECQVEGSHVSGHVSFSHCL